LKAVVIGLLEQDDDAAEVGVRASYISSNSALKMRKK
jgi:hypothetical protein